MNVVAPVTRTKEAYAEFLKSKFWLDLRQRKLMLNPACQIPDCGLCTSHIHHVFYRQDWNDTQITDLLSVCGIHHRKIHGIPEPPPEPRLKPIQPARACHPAKTKEDYLKELYSHRKPPKLKLSKSQKRHLKRFYKSRIGRELRRDARASAAYQNLKNRGRL